MSADSSSGLVPVDVLHELVEEVLVDGPCELDVYPEVILVLEAGCLERFVWWCFIDFFV